jgi:indolepyruvate decarboxylase
VAGLQRAGVACAFDAPAPVIHRSNDGAEIDYAPRGPQHRDNAQL